MDLNEALAALRGAFPRVGWVLDDEFSYIFAAGTRNRVLVGVMHMEDGAWSAEGGKLPHVKAPDPVSAVRAWLAAQPTAAFYPEVQSGETVECHGVVVMQGASWSLAGWNGASLVDRQGAALDGLSPEGIDERCAVSYYPIVVRVPVPVEPPVLVGEVVP